MTPSLTPTVTPAIAPRAVSAPAVPAALGAVLLAGATAVIAAVTLMPTGDSGDAHVRWHLDTRPAHLAEDALNVLLFAPFGAALCLRGSTLARTATAGAAFSAAVETLQLHAVPGRYAELQDVLANALGAAIGWWIGGLLASLLAPGRAAGPAGQGHARFRE